MRLAFTAALLAMLLSLCARAAEHADQIPPKTPSFQSTEVWFDFPNLKDKPQGLVAFEISTMGRAGDMAYAWQAIFFNRGPDIISWTRFIYDCNARKVYLDWSSITDFNLKVLKDRASDRKWIEPKGKMALVALVTACSGKPPRLGESMTLGQAIAAARANQNPLP